MQSERGSKPFLKYIEKDDALLCFSEDISSRLGDFVIDEVDACLTLYWIPGERRLAGIRIGCWDAIVNFIFRPSERVPTSGSLSLEAVVEVALLLSRAAAKRFGFTIKRMEYSYTCATEFARFIYISPSQWPCP